MTAPAIRSHRYVLAAPDARTTAKWFIEALGFSIWMEPEGFVFLENGACLIQIGSCPDALSPADLGDHSYFAYLEVDDVDAWFQRAAAAIGRLGGDVISAPKDQPWGMREAGLRTPDGHRIMLGQMTPLP